jgi:hypothetical protein
MITYHKTFLSSSPIHTASAISRGGIRIILWIWCSLRRRSRRRRVCRNIPLRMSGRDGDVVVLFAHTIPLCDPAFRQRWRGEGGAFLTRSVVLRQHTILANINREFYVAGPVIIANSRCVFAEGGSGRKLRLKVARSWFYLATGKKTSKLADAKEAMLDHHLQPHHNKLRLRNDPRSKHISRLSSATF